MFGRRKAAGTGGRIDSLVGRDTLVRGDVEFSGGLHLDGRIVGAVRGLPGGAPATVWMGPQALIEGSVEVDQAIINGEVRGDVRGRERVVIGEKARVVGNVYYGAIQMTLGGRVEGKLIPLSAPPLALGHDAVAAAPGSEVEPSRNGELVLQPFDAQRTRT
jgi:cytoskeletal protein CcmA (bactofilin family)